MTLHGGQAAHQFSQMQTQIEGWSKEQLRRETELLKNLSPKVDREAGFIGTILSDKVDALRKRMSGAFKALPKDTLKHEKYWINLGKAMIPFPKTKSEISSMHIDDQEWSIHPVLLLIWASQGLVRTL